MLTIEQEVVAIRDYILYLKAEHGLHITLHPMCAEGVITATELVAFNLHDTPYCVFLKTCGEAYCHCVEKQGRIMEKCRREGAFIGTCHAGVREFVYPIFEEERCIGFISVSGYQDENGASYLGAIAQKYGIARESLQEVYDRLTPVAPDRRHMDTLILPLCRMLELCYLHEQSRSVRADLGTAVAHYLRKNHTSRITVEQLGVHFSVSRSYISRVFKRKHGMGIHAYVQKLRLEDAEVLLRNSDLSITEIAYSVGFADSNYFSSVFSEAFGISPRAYRVRAAQHPT